MELITNMLRPIYWRWRNPLYQLNTIIHQAKIIEDDILCVELKTGIKLFGKPDKIINAPARYGHTRKMDKITNFRNFGSFLLTLHDEYVSNIYERYYTLQEGNIVIDIGAAVGVFTVRASIAVGPKGKVIAIEPEAEHLALLRKTIKENGLDNVTIIPKGVWSTSGRKKLYLSQDTDVQHSLYMHKSQGT